MTTIANPVFSRQVFATPGRRQTDKNGAVQGFAQLFASILCSQLRRGILGSDSGPMGIAGGATGDIYGSFLDQAMGKALAKSPAMKSLNDIVSRQLDGQSLRRAAAGKSSVASPLSGPGMPSVPPAPPTAPLSPASGPEEAVDPAAGSTINDDRGPLLLPPRPAIFAPALPPPKILTEG